MTSTDVLVIGGGQAGLATGYHLKQAGIPFIIIEKESQIGQTWRNRYDSLVLFTPREYSDLPGMPFAGIREELPNKNETADYLELYASKLKLPIHLNTTVLNASKCEDGSFHVKTNQGNYSAQHIIIATGPFQKERIPSFANKLYPQIKQMHSSTYKNPEQLLEGNTLVVGAGNSGAQIAVEISKQRKVSLSAGHRLVSLPLKFLGKSIFYWFDTLGILRASNQSFLGRKIQSRPDPIFGLELKKRIKTSDITLVPKAIDADHNTIHFSDGTIKEFKNIIWSTGFKSDYSWLDLPHIINERGSLIHNRGISIEKGLYVVGMPWQSRRTSALIGGVGEDSRYIVNDIIENTFS